MIALHCMVMKKIRIGPLRVRAPPPKKKKETRNKKKTPLKYIFNNPRSSILTSSAPDTDLLQPIRRVITS